MLTGIGQRKVICGIFLTELQSIAEKCQQLRKSRSKSECNGWCKCYRFVLTCTGQCSCRYDVLPFPLTLGTNATVKEPGVSKKSGTLSLVNILNDFSYVLCIFFSHFGFKWYNEVLKSIQSYSGGLHVVRNIGIDTKIIQIGPGCPVMWRNVCFSCGKWRPSWKRAAILNFYVANGFFQKSSP